MSQLTLALAQGVIGEPMTRYEFLKTQGYNGCNEGTQDQLKQIKGFKLALDGVGYWIPETFIAASEDKPQPSEDTTVHFAYNEMKAYTASSLDKIQATPMDLETYNVLRGWTLPVGQDPQTNGYLVKDPSCAKNHELYEHGITWMSKADFENKYHPAETHVERVHNEHAELRSRSIALDSFLSKIKETNLNIHPVDRDLLWVQLQQQRNLDATLATRLEFAEPADAMEYKDFTVPMLASDLDHGTAMLFCELGYPILRKGWNGKQQHVFLAGVGELSTTDETEHKALSKLNAFTCITSKNGETHAWVASPTDIRANDWVVLFKF